MDDFFKPPHSLFNAIEIFAA